MTADTYERLYCATLPVPYTVGQAITPGWTRGFHAQETGTVELWLTDAVTSITIQVVAGNYYPYSVAKVGAGGTSTTVVLLR